MVNFIFNASRIASTSSGLQWGEIGERPMLDLAVLAIGLAQEVAGVALAVDAGDRAVDEHYGSSPGIVSRWRSSVSRWRQLARAGSS